MFFLSFLNISQIGIRLGYGNKKNQELHSETLDFSMFFGLVNRNDLFLVVASTSLANSMRHHKRTTFAAFYQVRSTHFPVCSSLISSSFGRFILRTNRHRLHLLYAFSIQFIVRRTCTGGPSHSHFIHYTHPNIECQANILVFIQFLRATENAIV